MSTTVTERFQENSAGSTYRVGPSATRAFQVHFDTNQGTPAAINAKTAVYTGFGVTIGVVHPNDASIFCIDIKSSCDDDLLTWKVVCSYSRPENEPPTPPRQPTATKPVISFSSITRQIIPLKAFGGALTTDPASLVSPAAVVPKNSANDPFSEVPPIDQVNGLIRIGLYMATFDASLLISHLNHLNSAAITVAGVAIPKWQGKVNAINADKVYEENGTDYHFIVNYEIEYMIDTPMYVGMMDQGLKELNSTVPREISINGRPVTEPWPLNGSGVALTPVERATASNFKYWRYYFTMDANWGTPTTILKLPSSL